MVSLSQDVVGLSAGYLEAGLIANEFLRKHDESLIGRHERIVEAALVVVDPAHTSQTCCACRAVDAASRISRSRFVCTNCGAMSDADVNAAKNIRALGINTTAGLPGMAYESSWANGRKQEEGARKGGSLALQGRE